MRKNFKHTLLHRLFCIILISQDGVRNDESPSFVGPDQFMKNLSLSSQHPFDEEHFGRTSSNSVCLHRVQRRVPNSACNRSQGRSIVCPVEYSNSGCIS